ncbi:MAG: adenylyl-sulfate reductase [Gammaproteobacteria bacterium]|nr:adenylyl-sulfate reductase [Gammaproteobacteria bacterium]
MFTNNPFAELSASIPPAIMKTYVIVMVVLVIAGTLFDIIHKRSARYFFESWRQAKTRGSKQVGGGEMFSLAIRTLCVEVLTSAEFCTARRRIAHLLTMYGFLAYVVTAAIMVLCYPTTDAPGPTILPTLWHIGALMVCVGGYWFWFFIRADVSAEGNSPFRIMHADIFILSLLASVTMGLVWSFLQSAGASWWTDVFFALYVIATTVLFGSVPWSKFAHMFFKPAAAFEKRVAEANGSRSKLPPPADKPEVFGSARRLPQNY